MKKKSKDQLAKKYGYRTYSQVVRMLKYDLIEKINNEFENMKNSYARIDFKNCNVDYDYTICEWQDVGEYTELVQMQSEDLNEDEYLALKASEHLPSAAISVVMMTDQEFSDWFRDNVEANA